MSRLAVPVLVTTVIALGSCSKTSVGTSAEAQVRIDILHECLPALYEKLDAILDLAEAWRLNGNWNPSDPFGLTWAELGDVTIYGGVTRNGFGISVSGAGDVNKDGYDDLIVGAPYADAEGGVQNFAQVVSGLDRSILYTFLGDSLTFGQSVAGAGDVNQDGYDDLIVGAPEAPDSRLINKNANGSARVFSGFDGSILYTLYGEPLADVFGRSQFGTSVAGAGDVNQDGYADLVIGAPGDTEHPSTGVYYREGSARVFSGFDGSILYTFYGDLAGHPLGDRFGSSVAGAGDVNKDGFDDLIVGAFRNDDNGSSSGSARVLSGVDGSII